MSFDHTEEEFLEDFKEIFEERGPNGVVRWAWHAYEYSLLERDNLEQHIQGLEVGPEGVVGTYYGTKTGERTFYPSMLGESLRSKILAWQAHNRSAEVRLAPGQCCPRDDDGDGNCDIHESPGVLRQPRKG